jgi:hypothetical protein
MQLDKVNQEFNNMMRDLFPEMFARSPRYSYWTGPRGEMYCCTTEPLNGKFVCWTYQPFGEGSRTGKAKQWKMVDRVEFARRKVAKARAYSRYIKAKGEVANA